QGGVDALVSNTSGSDTVPVRSRLRVLRPPKPWRRRTEKERERALSFFFLTLTLTLQSPSYVQDYF
ncbi:MAG: hypothetical protein JXR66_02740, partial [Bacteroidales bacterium]|nr:hypothetical protein [Bacteroidales bacterium]